MRFASLDTLGVSPWRLAGVGVGAAAAAAVATGFVAGDSLGEARDAAAGIVGALVFYIVLSTPRRLVDERRVSQARESTLLSASAAACVAVTGSRPRALILLRPGEGTLASSLKDAGRSVLLGTRVERAVEASARELSSYSAAAAFRGIASYAPAAIDQGDEESRGLASSSDLVRETKIPMMMTVCFFAPIMLTLYAIFSHSYGAVRLAELAAFEFVAVDLAFYLSSAERTPP